MRCAGRQSLRTTTKAVSEKMFGKPCLPPIGTTVAACGDFSHCPPPMFIGADLWWEEDEEGKTRFSTGVHCRDRSYRITIRRYPVRESVILDTQRLGVLTGQYVRAIKLCSTVRRFKEAVQKVTAAAMRRGYGMREQNRGPSSLGCGGGPRRWPWVRWKYGLGG